MIRPELPDWVLPQFRDHDVVFRISPDDYYWWHHTLLFAKKTKFASKIPQAPPELVNLIPPNTTVEIILNDLDRRCRLCSWRASGGYDKKVFKTFLRKAAELLGNGGFEIVPVYFGGM